MTSPMGSGEGMFIEKSYTTKGQKTPFKRKKWGQKANSTTETRKIGVKTKGVVCELSCVHGAMQIWQSCRKLHSTGSNPWVQVQNFTP